MKVLGIFENSNIRPIRIFILFLITVAMTLRVCSVAFADASFTPLVPKKQWFFNFSTDVAVDRDGNVYVADTGNNRIQKFTSAGVL